MRGNIDKAVDCNSEYESGEVKLKANAPSLKEEVNTLRVNRKFVNAIVVAAGPLCNKLRDELTSQKTELES